jgi:hypothetical protein
MTAFYSRSSSESNEVRFLSRGTLDDRLTIPLPEYPLVSDTNFLTKIHSNSRYCFPECPDIRRDLSWGRPSRTSGSGQFSIHPRYIHPKVEGARLRGLVIRVPIIIQNVPVQGTPRLRRLPLPNLRPIYRILFHHSTHFQQR